MVPSQTETHAPPEQAWPAGQVTVGMVQLCVSVVVDDPHPPPEQEDVVTVRVCVPVPPHASALHALQAP
jgi:hypothetical protein